MHRQASPAAEAPAQGGALPDEARPLHDHLPSPSSACTPVSPCLPSLQHPHEHQQHQQHQQHLQQHQHQQHQQQQHQQHHHEPAQQQYYDQQQTHWEQAGASSLSSHLQTSLALDVNRVSVGRRSGAPYTLGLPNTPEVDEGEGSTGVAGGLPSGGQGGRAGGGAEGVERGAVAAQGLDEARRTTGTHVQGGGSGRLEAREDLDPANTISWHGFDTGPYSGISGRSSPARSTAGSEDHGRRGWSQDSGRRGRSTGGDSSSSEGGGPSGRRFFGRLKKTLTSLTRGSEGGDPFPSFASSSSTGFKSASKAHSESPSPHHHQGPLEGQSQAQHQEAARLAWEPGAASGPGASHGHHAVLPSPGAAAPPLSPAPYQDGAHGAYHYSAHSSGSSTPLSEGPSVTPSPGYPYPHRGQGPFSGPLPSSSPYSSNGSGPQLGLQPEVGVPAKGVGVFSGPVGVYPGSGARGHQQQVAGEGAFAQGPGTERGLPGVYPQAYAQGNPQAHPQAHAQPQGQARGQGFQEELPARDTQTLIGIAPGASPAALEAYLKAKAARQGKPGKRVVKVVEVPME